jgi:hypothetical protein
VFDRASLNVGEAYDETTGKFTCKVDGLYTFSWTTLSKSKKDLTTVLITNGNRVVQNVVDTDKTLSLAAASRVHPFFVIYKAGREPTPYW